MEIRNIKHASIKNGIVYYTYTTKDSMEVKNDTLEADHFREIERQHVLDKKSLMIVQNLINRND